MERLLAKKCLSFEAHVKEEFETRGLNVNVLRQSNYISLLSTITSNLCQNKGRAVAKYKNKQKRRHSVFLLEVISRLYFSTVSN